jgi:hypothetical protein
MYGELFVLLGRGAKQLFVAAVIISMLVGAGIVYAVEHLHISLDVSADK